MNDKAANLAIVKDILEWYKDNGFRYPWRSTSNLYEILVTEILLQKTIAKNVENLFTSFFNKYKNFTDILNSNLEDLEKDLKPLGLSNKRAKILKDLASMVIIDYKNEIPSESEPLQSINGIGEYVSNAFLCFGKNIKTIFVDVNINRIISRLFLNDKRLKLREFLHENIKKLLPPNNCKEFYWGLLDLGNKVCVKRNPKCDECPLKTHCLYLKNQ